MNIKKVKITEVGPRDGFQSEKTILKTEDKIDVINHLIDAGFQRIEVSSFVSPKAIPQLADAETILNKVKRNSKSTLAALVPNAKGALRAVEVMLNGSLKQLNNLKGENREALYDEYKEWLEVDDNNVINDGVLYCNYLG